MSKTNRRSVPGYEALLAELNERLGRLTQTELAALAGTSLSHINDVVAGRRPANAKLTEYLGFEMRIVPMRRRSSSPSPDESARAESLEAGA